MQLKHKLYTIIKKEDYTKFAYKRFLNESVIRVWDTTLVNQKITVFYCAPGKSFFFLIYDILRYIESAEKNKCLYRVNRYFFEIREIPPNPDKEKGRFEPYQKGYIFLKDFEAQRQANTRKKRISI